MPSVEESKNKVRQLYQFWKDQPDKQELDYIFDRIQGKEDFSNTQPELISDIDSRIKSRYPSRSNLTNLGIVNRNLNSKFCKDGYMYILRGDYRNCENGFYSLQYALTGKNIEQLSYELTPKEADYLCTRSDSSFFREDLEDSSVRVFLSRQTQNGGASFISSTTNFQIAEEFASAKKGEIYVLKVRTTDIIKAVKDLRSR